MPEDIKKAIIVIVPSLPTGPPRGPLAQEGAWVETLPSSGMPEIAMATLLTGASPATHGVISAKGPCRAEYIWEAALRSSKKTALFGWPCDRPPAINEISVQASAVASFLRTSPDWDLCWAKLERNVEEGAAEILSASDEETLRVLLILPDEKSAGSCLLAGPGIKRGAALSRKVRLEDVVPTICYLAEISIPADCEGGVIYQALEDPDMKIKELRAVRRNYERLRRSTGPSAMC